MLLLSNLLRQLIYLKWMQKKGQLKKTQEKGLEDKKAERAKKGRL